MTSHVSSSPALGKCALSLPHIERRGWDFTPSAVSFGGAIHESIKSFHKDSQYDCVKDESVYSERFRDQFILDVDNSNVVFRDVRSDKQ